MNAKTLLAALKAKILSKLSTLEESVGKTILSVYEDSESLFIKYTDGTFSYVYPETSGYEGDSAYLVAFAPHNFSDFYPFVTAGIISDSEFKEFKEYKDLERLEFNKDRLDIERQTYLQLKAKFEPNN